MIYFSMKMKIVFKLMQPLVEHKVSLLDTIKALYSECMFH